MNQEILINAETKETRCAFLQNGILHDLVIERKNNRQLTGNVYRGKVTNILHNIQSAFIDINEGENGFIHISDILENTQKFQELFDMDFDMAADTKSKKKQSETDIAKILKPDQPVLVQVVKEPIGSKGARLTSNVSIAGRYLVLVPSTPHRGVSRKIEDRAAQRKTKKTDPGVRDAPRYGPYLQNRQCQRHARAADPGSQRSFRDVERHHGEV